MQRPSAWQMSLRGAGLYIQILILGCFGFKIQLCMFDSCLCPPDGGNLVKEEMKLLSVNRLTEVLCSRRVLLAWSLPCRLDWFPSCGYLFLRCLIIGVHHHTQLETVYLMQLPELSLQFSIEMMALQINCRAPM